MSQTAAYQELTHTCIWLQAKSECMYVCGVCMHDACVGAFLVCIFLDTHTHVFTAYIHAHKHTHNTRRDLDNNRLRTLPLLLFSDTPRIKTFNIHGNAQLQCFPPFLSLPPELFSQIQDGFDAVNTSTTGSINESVSVSSAANSTMNMAPNATRSDGGGADVSTGGYMLGDRQVYIRVDQGIPPCPTPRLVGACMYLHKCVCVCFMCFCDCVHGGDTDCVHVGDTDDVHVGDTDCVHVGDTDCVHVGDTDGVHVGDTDGGHVGDTDGVHVGDTDGVHVGDIDGVTPVMVFGLGQTYKETDVQRDR
jgi:hypothetical protein